MHGPAKRKKSGTAVFRVHASTDTLQVATVMRPGIAFWIQFLPNKLPRPDMRWRRNVTAEAEAKTTTEASSSPQFGASDAHKVWTRSTGPGQPRSAVGPKAEMVPLDRCNNADRVRLHKECIILGGWHQALVVSRHPALRSKYWTHYLTPLPYWTERQP